jgi:hypothetical protein
MERCRPAREDRERVSAAAAFRSSIEIQLDLASEIAHGRSLVGEA